MKKQEIERDKNRTESFLGLMDKYGILDVQLLPPSSQSDSDYFMRVTRMPANQTIEFMPDALLSELCSYHQSDVCKLMGLKRTMLDTRPDKNETLVLAGSQGNLDIEMYRVSVSLFHK